MTNIVFVLPNQIRNEWNIFKYILLNDLKKKKGREKEDQNKKM